MISFKYINLAICALFSGGFAMAQQPTPLPVPAPYSANILVNKTTVWDAAKPGLSATTIQTQPANAVKQTAQYFDGLGRPLQTVAKQGAQNATGNLVDVVSAQVYDEFGRNALQYLPFNANSTGGNSSITDGGFKLNPFAQQATFMQQQYGSQGETFFYGRAEFEPSPLNRTTTTLASGNSWVGNNKGVTTAYFNNTSVDEVRIWEVTEGAIGSFGTYSTAVTYPEGRLTKTIATDEHGKQVIEFKNANGQSILKKVQLTATSDNGLGSGHAGWLCTYYIYDKVGNPICVIQPKAVDKLLISSWQLTTGLLDELTFRYAYDTHNRLIVKKVPGAGEVYMVYDSKGRLVLTQDGNMRQQGKWLYTQYDVLNRIATTGLLANTQTATAHRTAAENSATYPDLTGQQYEELSRNFYDGYGWLSNYALPITGTYNTLHNSFLMTASNTVWPYPQAPVQSNATKGLATGTRVKVLGSTNTYLYTVVIYDDKGRTIQIQSTNMSGGADIVTTQYAWSGQPLMDVVKHEKSGTNAQTSTVITKFSYDDLWRLVKTENKMANSLVNDGAMPDAFTVVSQQTYDELGQIKKKELGPSAVGVTSGVPLETLEHDYNIRGWLLGTNRNYISGANNGHWFGFELAYDKPGNIIAGQSYAAPQYNGNISGSTWKAAGDGEKRKYDFTYDAVNRLTGADFNQFTNSSFNKTAGLDFSVSGLGYDANGNILGMEQKGWKSSGSGFIDQLLYSYQTNSNKLNAVTDASNDNNSKLGDFKYDAATKTTSDYSYDVNGNLILDNNKNISSIIYNHLNLPQLVTVTGQGSIEYVYDAGGNKLKKVVHETGKPDKVTEYINGFVYEDNQLQFAPHEEGRIRFAKQYYLNNESADVLAYDWFLKDHLGNVRTVLTSQTDTAKYMASFETSLREKENALFANIETTAFPIQLINSSALHEINEYNGEMASRLNGSELKTGAAITLKVMAGDKVDIGTQYWYPINNSTNASPINPDDLFSLLLHTLSGGASGLSGGKATSGELSTTGSPVYSALQGFLGNQTDADNVVGNPKAYLNWILLDEQFKYVPSGSGFIKVGGYSDSWTALASTGIPISKSGYLFVYLSNQTIGQNVFFDNLVVQHYTGPLVEENQYYPFGLIQKGISSKAFGRLENKIKFNGYEENKTFDLNWLESFYRTYDPQLGRFWQVDPKPDESGSLYRSMNNNPILMNDLLGDTITYYNNNNEILYQTFVKGHNDVVIIADEAVETFNKFVSISRKYIDPSLKAQKTFDWFIGLLGIGTAYDITSFDKFGDENAYKYNVKQIDGISPKDMKNLKINGKVATEKDLNKVLGAEAYAELFYKDGKWTVDKKTTNSKHDLRSGLPLSGTHIHTHAEFSIDIKFNYRGFAYNGGLDVRQPGINGDLDYAKQSGKDNNRHPRNVTVTKEYIYLINGNPTQTIRIKR